MDEKRTRHPSFGQLQISRTTSNTGKPLYGSALRHSNTVCLSIHTSELYRSLHNDHYFPTGTVVEVEMSEQQFAQAITSMNIGSGIPVTIRRREGKSIEDCPASQEREIFTKEFADDLKRVLENSSKLVTKAEELCNQKTVTKGQLNEIRGVLKGLQTDLSSNLAFVNNMFIESIDKAVSSAKHEIEAHMGMVIRNAGLEALGQKYAPPQIGMNDDKAV